MLQNVNVQNLTLNAGGQISDGHSEAAGQGRPLIVRELADLRAEGNNIDFSHPDNDFRRLRLNDIGDITLADANSLVVETAQLNGALSLSAERDLSSQGLVSAAIVDLSANTGRLHIQQNLSATESLSLNGQSVDIASAVRLDNSVGTAGRISVNSRTHIDLQAPLSASGGQIQLQAGTHIIDTLAQGASLIAEHLIISAESGIGAEDNPLDLSVARLEGLNDDNGVYLRNDRELTVSRLRNNGDIELSVTEGNLLLDNSADNTYVENQDDARKAGGVINANVEVGHLSIQVDRGYLARSPGQGADEAQPELVAARGTMRTAEGFGDSNRGLVIYIPGTLMVSGGGVRPLYYNGIRSRLITGGQSLIDPSIIIRADELLVGVEKVEDIHPALFTDIRNYYYPETAIKLPRDQDEDEEDEDDDIF